jgi:hypothetical protein
MLLPKRNARLIVGGGFQAYSQNSIFGEPLFDLREQSGGNSKAPVLFENVHRDNVTVFVAAGADAKTRDFLRRVDFRDNTFGAGECQVCAHVRP